MNIPSWTWSDLLSSGFIWLTLGAVLLSYVSINSSNKLWWVVLGVVVLAFFAKSLLLFFILFELSIIPILLMILFWGSQPERLSAGIYFLIYTGFLSIPYLVLILFLIPYGNFMLNLLTDLPSIFCLIFVAPFLVNIPVYGLHFWLPNAHVEASTSGSMVLAGLLLNLGAYGVYRISSILSSLSLTKLTAWWILSALISSVVTFMQSDLNNLIAYSSVTHITFIMVGLSGNTNQVLISILILSLAHGWASITIFSTAGMLSHSVSSRLGILVSSEHKFHWNLLLLGGALLSNASLPPFPSFYPELSLVISLLSSSNLIILFVFLSVSVCYYNAFLFITLISLNNNISSGNLDYNEFFNSTSLVLITLASLTWIALL